MPDADWVIRGFSCSRPRVIPVWKIIAWFISVAKQIAIPSHKVRWWRCGSGSHCDGGHRKASFVLTLRSSWCRWRGQRHRIQHAWQKGAMGASLARWSPVKFGIIKTKLWFIGHFAPTWYFAQPLEVGQVSKGWSGCFQGRGRVALSHSWACEGRLWTELPGKPGLNLQGGEGWDPWLCSLKILHPLRGVLGKTCWSL